VKKSASVLVLLLFLSVFMVSLPQIGEVKAQDTIYIRSDGIVEGTDKIHRDDNVYTFTDNIVNQKTVIEKDNIVVDGAGYTLEGASVWLENRRNVTIKNMQITRFGEGIRLMGKCENNAIIGNNITDIDGNAIWVTFDASDNTISGNNITGNHVGIFVYMSGDTIISENYIIANEIGVWLHAGNNRVVRNDIINNSRGILVDVGVNIIYHNNFVNNNVQADVNEAPSAINIWNNGYPSGGNYWSDYNGTDNDGDGIGDSPYILNENNQDNFPLTASRDILIIPEFPYIRADGIVEGTDKIQRDGDVYTLTSDIFGGITVRRDFIVIDGAGYAVRGRGEGRGIDLKGCVNVTVQNLQIIDFLSGIRIVSGANIIIKNNTFVNNINPISIAYSGGGGHVITENSFIDGTFIIVWLSPYPTVDRNYWDDYNGTDADGDGIGDIPYVYGGDQETKYMDYHPLMDPVPIIPEFPSWAPLLIMLLLVSAVVVIYRRNLKNPNHGRRNQ
jgi:parallel beta-helix repeat protein